MSKDDVFSEVDFTEIDDLLFEAREQAAKNVLLTPLNAVMFTVICISAYLHNLLDKQAKGY